MLKKVLQTYSILVEHWTCMNIEVLDPEGCQYLPLVLSLLTENRGF
jgi:hypothetical protein